MNDFSSTVMKGYFSESNCRIDNEKLDFGLAEMNFIIPKFIHNAILKNTNIQNLGYYNHYNDHKFMQKIKTYFYDYNNEKITCGIDVIFSNGALDSLFDIVNYCSVPGDNIMVLDPTYGGFHYVISETGRNLVSVNMNVDNKTETYELPLEKMNEAINSYNVKMLIISNPHNPSGKCWTKEELSVLSKFCVKNEILLISDEVHSQIIRKKEKFISLHSVCSRGIVINSICKTYNVSDLKTAFIFIPQEIANMISIPKNKSISMFNKNITESIFEEGDKWLLKMNALVAENKKLVTKVLKAKFPSSKIFVGEATYFIWIDFTNTHVLDAHGFFDNKLNIKVTSGEHMGVTKKFVRLNLARRRSEIDDFIERINKYEY